MQETKAPKKPLTYYVIVSTVILILLNIFVFPALLQTQIVETDYSTFLKHLEEGAVKRVEIKDDMLYYEAEVDGQETIFVTGMMPDDQLTERLHKAGVSFSRVIPKEASPLLVFLLSWILPIAIFFLLGQYLMNVMQKRGIGPNAMSFGKAGARIYIEAQTGITFDDVAGQDEAKEALQEIIDFLHNPQKYTEIGAKMPKGVLLVGPPGTGKTLLAKAVAGEAKVPFFSISGSEFVEMFVGLGAAKVRDLFRQADEKAPCIVFIDEIDTIGKSRDQGILVSNDEREQTLNQLLTEMDGFDSRKGVVILAATNRPEALDKALLRPGRFDRRIPVELPDLKGREEILKVHARSVKMQEPIDFNAIARATAGASGADLANIINEAALRAVRHGRKAVTQEDLEASVEVVIAGYERKNAVIPDEEKEVVAYHEIGHALVAALQTESAPVHKITIVPRTSGALGFTLQLDEKEKVLMTREEALNKVVTLTGGRAAEELIFNTVTTGAANDIEQATKIARAMITRFGMSETFGMVALEYETNPYLGQSTMLSCSDGTAEKIDEEVILLIKNAHDKAWSILSDNQEKLHKGARALMEKETLTGEQFMQIINEPVTVSAGQAITQ